MVSLPGFDDEGRKILLIKEGKYHSLYRQDRANCNEFNLI